MAKNWKEVAEGFVEGFVHGYHLATKANNTGFDGAAVRRQAEALALEHVEILKQAQSQKNAANAKEAPLDAIFEGKE
jgi:hypothetical protein